MRAHTAEAVVVAMDDGKGEGEEEKVAALTPRAPQGTTGREAWSASTGKPRAVLIVHRVSKKRNVGTIARSCAALGVDTLVFAGGGGERRKALPMHGSQGADRFLAVRSFPKLEQCCDALRAEGFSVCGVEIHGSAVSVGHVPAPWRGPTAFLLGEEGHGLTEAEIAACDHLVYIPQVGDGTASLNVAVSAGIVFHRFAEWAGHEERPREGAKFVVGVAPQKGAVSDEERAQIQAQRAAKRRAREQEAEAEREGRDGGGEKGQEVEAEEEERPPDGHFR